MAQKKSKKQKYRRNKTREITVTKKQYKKIKRFMAWRRLKLSPTGQKLTDAAGLGTVVEAFEESFLAGELDRCLPKRVGNRTYGSRRLALTLISAFIYGHECLDDLLKMRDDPYFDETLEGKISVPKTMGDFLRDFKREHIEALNSYLALQAKTYRKYFKTALEEKYQPGALVEDIDSTDHVQSGELMEGLAYNYKGNWCLDSQVVFDDMGLCAGLQLRSGNTKSGVGAEELIRQVFSGLDYREEKHLRADSAYLEQDVLRACMFYGVTYTIAAHDNHTNWKEKRKSITQWTRWKHSKSAREKSDKKGKTLPKVELGRFYWTPGWAPNLKIPVIVKRTWKDGEPRKKRKDQSRLPFDQGVGGFWEYYAVVTSQNLFLKSYQEVFEFYQKRGQAESFIREQKYGYDLKHFPCQKLSANHAYGLLAMVAHNILRWAAVLESPDKPHYSKKMRRNFIHIPGKLVKHARQITVKIAHRHYEEVMRLKAAMQLCQEQTAFNTS